MDSVTQAALGAAVGVAAMGRTRPVWQSALIGAAVGTLPDLDVFIQKPDAIRDMILHRAETHAFFWQLLISPLIAGALALVTRSRELYGRWLLLVALGLMTHAMLDALTIYGTRIWMPFSGQPVGLGSLFIIDPLYTVPLALGVLLAVAWRRPTGLRWNTAGLIVSTLYAGWSVAAQAYVTDRVMQTEQARDLPAQRVLVTATPFNTLLWRIVLLDDESYREGFYSLLDPLTDPGRPIRFQSFPRGAALDRKTTGFEDANLIREFSKGFYALSDDGRRIRITDLRMGQHPFYAFSFAFAEHHSEPLLPIDPLRIRQRIPVERGLAWLLPRISGIDIPPPRF